MSREILFRGKRTDNGEWINDSETYIRDGDGIWLSDEDLHVVTIRDDTLGLYTGLTDKNGKKIFEGDIVKLLDKMIGTVIFECGAFSIAFKNEIDWDYIESEILKYTGCDNMACVCFNDNVISLWEIYWNFNEEENSLSVVEVIGNFYDNPELLEKE